MLYIQNANVTKCWVPANWLKKKNWWKMQQTLSNRFETGTNLSQAHDLYLAGCSVVYSFSSYYSIHRSKVTLLWRCSTVTLGLQGLTNSPVLIHIHGHITDHIVTGFAEKAVWVTPPSQQALMNDPMQVHAYEYWSGHATWSGAWPCSTSQCFFDSRWCCLLFLTSRRLRSKGTNAS